MKMGTFLCLLGLLFIGLKLTGYIAWSWWLVLLPLYGGLALVAVFFLLFLLFGAAVIGASSIRFK